MSCLRAYWAIDLYRGVAHTRAKVSYASGSLALTNILVQAILLLGNRGIWTHKQRAMIRLHYPIG
jgi:hypothetical protein